MRLWMIDKAKRLVREDKVEYKYSNDKVSVWEVKDEKNYKLIADRDFEISCTCLYGIGRGTQKGLCPHQLAVLFYLSKNYESFKEREEDKEIDFQKRELKNELTDTQKKKLKEIFDCELKNENCEGKLNIHRIERKGPYSLRNIMILCDKHHKEIHSGEKGHINR